MKNRILPEPDRFATCPLDGNILSYYEGVFEAVFVSLHPFIRPTAIPKDLFVPGSGLARETIANCCEPVCWSKVVELANLPSIASVDIGLRTQINGLRKEFANQAFAAALRKVCEQHGLIEPTEGYFSDLLHDKILGCVQEVGHDWAWVGGEFGTERTLYWIDDLKSDGKEKEVTMGRCSVFTTDKTLLWTTHWDSHVSLLCGPRETLQRIVDRGNLEGFFCDRETEVYWSTQKTDAEAFA